MKQKDGQKPRAPDPKLGTRKEKPNVLDPNLKTPRSETPDSRPAFVDGKKEPLTSTSIALTKAELTLAIHTQESAWILMRLWENPQNLKNLVELLKDPEHAFKAAILFFYACDMGTDVQPVATDLWRMVMADELYADQETKIKLLGIACRARIDDEIIGPIKELLWKKRTKDMLEEMSNALGAARNETMAKLIIEMLAEAAVDGTTRSLRSNARYALLTLVKKDVDITVAFQILKDILTSRDTNIDQEERIGIVKLVFEAVKKGADPSDILPETIKFATNGSVFYHMRSEHDIIIMGFLIFLCTDDRYKEKYRDYIISKMIEAGVPSEMDSRFTRETGRKMNLDPITFNFLAKANERYVDISAAVPKLFEMLGRENMAINGVYFVLKEAAKNGNGHVLAVITASVQKTLSSKEFMKDTAENTPDYEANIKAIAEIMDIVKEREHWLDYEKNKGKKDETKE